MTVQDSQLAQLLDQLHPPLGLAPDWDDALTRSTAESPNRIHRSRKRSRPILAASLTFALVIVLVVVSPWHHGPSVVALASAALTPAHGTIVYEYFEETSTNVKTRTTHHGTNKLWLTPDGRFRSVQQVAGRARREQGRLRAGLPLLTLTGSSKTIEAVCDNQIAPIDPVQLIRSDLRKGTLRARGRVEIHNRAALLLVHDTPTEHDNLYVNPRTFYPIELRSRTTGHTNKTVNIIMFRAYRYLPATPHNLKLTSIQAENPQARIIPDYEALRRAC